MKRKQEIPRRIRPIANGVADEELSRETTETNCSATDVKKQKITEEVPDLNNISETGVEQESITSTITLGDTFKNCLQNQGFPLILNVYSLSKKEPKSKEHTVKRKQDSLPVTPPSSPPVKDIVVTNDNPRTCLTYSPRSLTTNSKSQSCEHLPKPRSIKKQQPLENNIVPQTNCVDDNINHISQTFRFSPMSQLGQQSNQCHNITTDPGNVSITNSNQYDTMTDSCQVLAPPQVPVHKKVTVGEKEASPLTPTERRVARLKQLMKEQEEFLERLKAKR